MITALAVDPANSKVLYAGFERKGYNELRTSTDEGKTWRALTSLPDAAKRIYADPRSTQQDRTLEVVTSGAVMVREGGKWTSHSLPSSKGAVVDVAAGFSKVGPVIYAVSGSAVFVSDDSGTTWRESQLPGSGARIRAIAASESNPDVAYVYFKDLRMGLPGFTKNWFGVARTVNRGRSWEFAWKSSGEDPGNVQDAWITQFFGAGYGG